MDHYKGLVPENYLTIALNANKSREKQYRVLLEKRKLPQESWDDNTIEMFVQQLANFDSNNFPNKCGVGEREARIACRLVQQRHYNLGHGIGRSGDLSESQPKAVGSSIMAQLTNCLLLDLIREMGVSCAKKALLVPMATGMTLMLCFLTLHQERPSSKYVLWSRIDQKSCFKAILTANLTPIIVSTISKKEALITDVEEFRRKIEELGADNIVCIYSTTSCFAPRNCDDIVELGQLAKEFNIPHVINNAYGLQSTFYTHQIQEAIRLGRVDYFVQSTDKNLMVPVGGAVVCSPNEASIDNLSKMYAGRASSSQTLDVLMTLLSLGKSGYLALVRERRENFEYLKGKLSEFAKQHDGLILDTKYNRISVAMVLKNVSVERASMLGSMLFIRGVSGCRVVTGLEEKTMGGHHFKQWGSHTNTEFGHSYLTAAAGIGITRLEIEELLKKLEKVIKDLKVQVKSEIL